MTYNITETHENRKREKKINLEYVLSSFVRNNNNQPANQPIQPTTDVEHVFGWSAACIYARSCESLRT